MPYEKKWYKKPEIVIPVIIAIIIGAILIILAIPGFIIDLDTIINTKPTSSIPTPTPIPPTPTPPTPTPTPPTPTPTPPTPTPTPPTLTPTPTEDGKPIAKISGPTWAKPFDVVEFSAQESIDPDGTISRYHWSLGDGVPATTKIVKHRYEAEGIYEVNLTVWDFEKNVDITTHDIHISHTNPKTKLPDLEILEDFYTFGDDNDLIIDAGKEFSISGIIKNNNFYDVTQEICVKLEFKQRERVHVDDSCGYKIFKKPEIRFQFDPIIGLGGTYLLTFTVDPENRIEETNEDNNTTEYILNVQ